MEKTYLLLILNNRKNLSEVPTILKSKVVELLNKKKENGEISEDRYNEIINS